MTSFTYYRLFYHLFFSILQIPEFDIVSPTYSLKDPLGRLGLVNIFNPTRASLHDISRFMGVHVSDILHKVRIKITVKEKQENATDSREARQFQQNLVQNNPMHADGLETEGMNTIMPLNNAFLYFIVDHKTETLLFTGKYVPNDSNRFEVSTIAVPEITPNDLTPKTSVFIPITDGFTIIDETTDMHTETTTTTTSTTTTTTKAPTTQTTLPPVATTTTTVTTPSTTPIPTSTNTPVPASTPPVVAVESPNSIPLENGSVLLAKSPNLKKPVKLKDIVKKTSIRIGNSDMKQLIPAKTSNFKKLYPSEGVGEVKFYKL